MWTNTQNRPRSTDEKGRQENVKIASDATSEYNNPCIKEQKLVYKCLDQNNYDNSKCMAHIANLKACKQFWHDVRSDRMKNGLKPSLPWPEERERIKEEYLKKWKLKLSN